MHDHRDKYCSEWRSLQAVLFQIVKQPRLFNCPFVSGCLVGLETAAVVTGGDDQAVRVGLFQVHRQEHCDRQQHSDRQQHRDKHGPEANHNNLHSSVNGQAEGVGAWCLRLLSTCCVESGHTSAVRVRHWQSC